MRLALLVALFAVTCPAQVRLTDIQIIGTHNSYHQGISPNELALLRSTSPASAESLDYKHAPLQQQLDWGVRKFELDVFSDTKGGLFADPGGPRWLKQAGIPLDPPYEFADLMRKPGHKVLHVQDLDYRSRCQPFIGCLEIIRNWSKAHPRHLPIFIQIENKMGNPRPKVMVDPEPITTASLEALDAEIRSVFAKDQLITPDDVRGDFATLEEAVLKRGWPELDKARGKVIFILDSERITALYATPGHESLQGRVMFTNGKPGMPDAAFIKMNNPNDPQLPQLVKKGYLIRTMTDGGAKSVKANDTKRRDAALASGAQILSTDYPFDWKHPESGYHVTFNGPIARCNPVRTSACTPEMLREDTPKARAFLRLNIPMMERYEGTYRFEDGSTIKIWRDGFQLRAQLQDGSASFLLWAEADDRFYVKERDAEIRLRLDEDNIAQGLEWTQGSSTKPARKIAR